MKNIHYISSDTLGLDMIKNIIDGQYTLTLSSDSRNNIVYCREYLDRKMVDTKTPIYGINTGFGSLHNIKISENELETLQENLVMSHSCGMGDLVPPEIVKLMLLLKIQSLSYGKSGIQLSTIERLIYFFNNNVLPVVYEQGSLGASGDLAPLAHLSLPLLGMGEVIVNGERIKTEDYYNANNLKPITLKSKEGLALLNGTQFMSAYGVQCLLDCMKLSDLADVVGALSLDAYDGRQEAFNEIIQLVRPHKGQLLTARRINKILRGSELIKNQKTETQDPYSFRCIPQVHGAVKDTINYVMSVVVNEINAVTDNPTIFPYEDMIISGGNFHGQPLAFVLDFLAIATAELGNISERRTYHLISGKRNLPKYLITSAGVNSGFMIPQYTAASIVSQNKQYCTPASVDSIESSDGQEDYVSMGANAATKLYKVIKNVEKVLAIELFNAAQAIEFRKPLNTSPYLQELLNEYRKYVPFIENDTIMYEYMDITLKFTKKLKIQL